MILIIGNCNTDIITQETAAAILGYVVTTVYSETGTGGTDREEEIGTVDPELEEEIGTVDPEEEIGTVDLEEEIGTVIITVLGLDPAVGIPSRGIVAMMEGVHGTVMLVDEKTLSITRAARHG